MPRAEALQAWACGRFNKWHRISLAKKLQVPGREHTAHNVPGPKNGIQLECKLFCFTTDVGYTPFLRLLELTASIGLQAAARGEAGGFV